MSEEKQEDQGQGSFLQIKLKSDNPEDWCQCGNSDKSEHFVGFGSPFAERNSAGYWRNHLCFKCYITLLYQTFCIEKDEE